MKLVLKNADGTRTEKEVHGLPEVLAVLFFIGAFLAILAVIFLVFLPVALVLLGWAAVVAVIALPVAYVQDRRSKRRRVAANRNRSGLPPRSR